MTFLWLGALAEALGMPIAWARLRRAGLWEGRPRNLRRIDLLAGFVRPAVEITMLWTVAMLAAMLIGTLLGWSGVWVGALILVFAGPLVFVPLIVVQRETAEFEAVVEEERHKRERKYPPVPSA